MNHASVLLIILGGVSAGLIHVDSGPDHLAAIAPLVIKQRRGAWLTGLRWGVGHSSGVAAVGILSLILRDWLPMDLISSWSDRLVGVFLIALGVWTLRYVRVVTVGDGSFSRELCGGCHVERTGDIGLCTITGERGVAAGAAELKECRTTRSGSEFTRCVRG